MMCAPINYTSISSDFPPQSGHLLVVLLRLGIYLHLILPLIYVIITFIYKAHISWCTVYRCILSICPENIISISDTGLYMIM